MTERLTVPDLTDDEQYWLNLMWDQLWARRERNTLRTSYYEMKHFVRDFGGLIAPQYRNLGFVLDWNAKGVDALARRCNPEGFYWPDGELDDLGYGELADANRLLAEVKAGLKSSLIHGVSFMVTTQGDPDAGEPAALVHAKDALNATGIWNTRTRSLDAALSIHEWDDDAPVRGSRPKSFSMYLDGVTVNVERMEGVWEVDRQTHRWGVPVEPLIYKPGTRTFGSSRITRATMVLQDSAVRTFLRMEGHMDIYSTPQMFLLGGDEKMFKNPDGTVKTAWQIVLGKVLGIPDDDDAANPRADVKQFAASSPQPHLAHLNALAKTVAKAFSLPDSSLSITDMANPTSGDAYESGESELIGEAEGATDDWSIPIRRTVARALAIHNGAAEIPELRSLGVSWRPPKYATRAAMADAGMKQLTAAPWLAETEVGLELLGLSKSQRERALAERARTQGRRTLASILAGGGVTADVVND